MFLSPVSVLLNEEDETKKFAANLASRLKPNDIILLYGDLGTGKTFICREIIKYFCGENVDVNSPTFNILQTYKISNLKSLDIINSFNYIYHFDLYRLKFAEEIYELGFEEALNNNLVLIEWPEIIECLLPKEIIKIELTITSDNKRYCKVNI